MARLRNWCFTLNNYTDAEWLSVQHLADDERVRYIVVGKEVGESGTPHLQGYIEFTSSMRLNAVRTVVSTRAHFEGRRGSAQQAADYCKKDSDFFEHGTLGGAQGRRSDLREVGEMIKEGESIRTVAMEHPDIYIKYHKGIEKLGLLALGAPPVWREVTVTVCIGPPGSGKTRWCYQQEDGVLYRPLSASSGLWWEDYRGQKAILLDDFYGGMCRFNKLLRLLDGYAEPLSVKGTSSVSRWERVYITSNAEPVCWYDYSGGMDFRALERRIDITKQFPLALMDEETELDEVISLGN